MAGNNPMTQQRMPVMFVSHGAPTLPFDDIPARAFLIELARKAPRPSAILVASAHWETDRPSLTASASPQTIHDFFGFPKSLYDLSYDAPGAPELAERAGMLLRQTGYDPVLDADRGRDHGVWVPMMLAYPLADVPVVQISLLRRQSTHAHVALGEALAPLRDEGVLIVGSGGAIHNLRQLEWTGGATPRWATDFQDWLDQQLAAGNVDALIAYRTMIDAAMMAHPSEDHFLPLLVALGAAKDKPCAAKLHGSFQYGSLSLAAYGWGL
jgi:4,5-DOPA dioxygenase extradiol